jgi:alkylhydroperoxidase/carboxymuconolactone decarboxylase family protein YurZ
VTLEHSARSRPAPGFRTGLDFSDVETIDPEEAGALLQWYEEAHGEGQGDLTPFVAFFIGHRPPAVKLYRQYAQALYEESGLPQLVIPLNFLYYYMTRGNERGVLYEVIAARAWGATKREVLETLELAFVHSGPLGGNAAAVAGDYLASWDETEPRRVPAPWPGHWLRSPDHQPSPVGDAVRGVLGQHLPRVLEAMERRNTHATVGTELPPAMAAMYTLHSAVAAGRTADVADEARRALSCGVTEKELLAAVGFAGLYATPGQLDAVFARLREVL